MIDKIYPRHLTTPTLIRDGDDTPPDVIQYLMDGISTLEELHKTQLREAERLNEMRKSLESKLQDANQKIIKLGDRLALRAKPEDDTPLEGKRKDIHRPILEYADSMMRDAQCMTAKYDAAVAEIKRLQDRIRDLTREDDYHDSGCTTSGQPTISKMQEQAEKRAKNAKNTRRRGRLCERRWKRP